MARFELTTQELLQLIDWTLAVKARIPKKYHRQLDRLLNAHREVLYTHRITIAAGKLALHWQCAVADLPKLLYRMTCRSKGRVIYRIGPGTPGLGTTVQLRFDVTLGDRQHDATAHPH
jgi:hypothetical protein